MKKITSIFMYLIGVFIALKIMEIGGLWLAFSPKTITLSVVSFFSLAIIVHAILRANAGDEFEDSSVANMIGSFSGLVGVIPVLFIFGTNLDWDKDYMCENYWVGGRESTRVWSYSDDLKYGSVGSYTSAYISVEKEQCYEDPEAYFSSSDSTLVINPYIEILGWIYSITLVGGALYIRNEASKSSI